MNEISWDDPGQKKRVQAIIEDFDREAHIVIHKYIDLYGLNGKYEVTPFSVHCISSFLMEWHFNDADDLLPEGAWSKCIRMYMRLIEIDFDYLEEIHALMKRRH